MPFEICARIVLVATHSGTRDERKLPEHHAMPLKPEVLDRLLLSKLFLEKIRFQPVAVHDRHTLAANIIAAHDAAELAIAGVCDQLGCLPQKGVSFSWTISSPIGVRDMPTCSRE